MIRYLQDWFRRRRLASRGRFLDNNGRVQQRVNFYDVKLRSDRLRKYDR
jgi:hypothetical protein